MNLPIIKLLPNKDKSVKNFHPWLFKSAISKVYEKVNPGDLVTIIDFNDNFLAYGYYNPSSKITIRLLEWNQNNIINDNWWYEKLKISINNRYNLFNNNQHNIFRLVNAESDFIPGLILDFYNNIIVMESLTAGIDKHKNIIIESIKQILKPECIYEKSDSEVRKLEGIENVNKIHYGNIKNEKIIVKENNCLFYVNLKTGQKTGFYIDQRNNRKFIRELASNLNILDCFCYTGGFTINCYLGNAKEITMVDSSSEALKLGKENLKLNQINESKIKIIEGNVFDKLRDFIKDNIKFDMIILDPPKLAPTKLHINKAERAYKDLNLHAMKLLNKNGLLITFSCSGGITPEHLKKIIGWASVDLKREVQILYQLHQSEDHPIRISYPESEYLKGFVCRVY